MPTIVRNVPGTGLYFSLLSLLKRKDDSPVDNALVGAASRVSAGLSMMPFTVLKVQMEVKRQHTYAFQAFAFVESEICQLFYIFFS